MRVIAYDPYLTDDRAKEMDLEKVDLEQAFVEADYLTVHMPLTDQTRGMVDANAFSKMKEGVRVFNCARGGIIDENALLEALRLERLLRLVWMYTNKSLSILIIHFVRKKT